MGMAPSSKRRPAPAPSSDDNLAARIVQAPRVADPAAAGRKIDDWLRPLAAFLKRSGDTR